MDNYIFFKSTKISILTMFTLHHSLYHTSIIMKLSYSLDSIDIFKLVINLKLSFQNSSQNWESSRVYQVTIKSCDHKLIAGFFSPGGVFNEFSYFHLLHVLTNHKYLSNVEDYPESYTPC